MLKHSRFWASMLKKIMLIKTLGYALKTCKAFWPLFHSSILRGTYWHPPPLTTYFVCTYNRHYHHYYIVACCNMSVALKLDQLYPLLLPIPLTYAWWGWEDNTMFDLLRTAITDNGSISKGVKNTKRSLILLIQGEKRIGGLIHTLNLVVSRKLRSMYKLLRETSRF